MRRINGKASKRQKTEEEVEGEDGVEVKDENGSAATAEEADDADADAAEDTGAIDDAGEEEEAEAGPSTSSSKSKKKTAASKKKGGRGKKGKKQPKKTSKKDQHSGDEGSEEEEYEVEAIVGQRFMHGKKQYRVRWQGHGSDADTWCGEGDLHCPELVREFLDSEKAEKADSKQKKKKPAPKKRKAAAEGADNAGDTSDEEEYEVDKLLEVKFKKNGKREFLVHWKGWGPDSNTWEPEEHLNCADLIEKLLAKVEKAKESTERELRTQPKATDRLTFDNPQLRTSRRFKNEKGGRTTYYNLE